MSISQQIPPLSIIPGDYSEDKGRFVAEAFAAGSSLKTLADDFPDYLPKAMYIKQWRRDYPGFDGLMRMAECAKADYLVDESVVIADDVKRPAAHAANSIKVRLAQAAALDQQTYGNKRIIAGDPDNPLLVGKVADLDDDALMRIARGGVIEHSPADPRHPPQADKAGNVIRRLPDPPIPATCSSSDSVTTPDDAVMAVITGVDPGF